MIKDKRKIVKTAVSVFASAILLYSVGCQTVNTGMTPI